MRLSDAIALGRVILEPTPFNLGEGYKGCALGMGAVSVAGIDSDRKIALVDNWPWLKTRTLNFPCKCPQFGLFECIVTHIFDFHITSEFYDDRWTLDQLIDWVRKNEPEEELPLSTGPVDCEVNAEAAKPCLSISSLL